MESREYTQSRISLSLTCATGKRTKEQKTAEFCYFAQHMTRCSYVKVYPNNDLMTPEELMWEWSGDDTSQHRNARPPH